jgi:hypothetical protein
MQQYPCQLKLHALDRAAQQGCGCTLNLQKLARCCPDDHLESHLLLLQLGETRSTPLQQLLGRCGAALDWNA